MTVWWRHNILLILVLLVSGYFAWKKWRQSYISDPVSIKRTIHQKTSSRKRTSSKTLLKSPAIVKKQLPVQVLPQTPEAKMLAACQDDWLDLLSLSAEQIESGFYQKNQIFSDKCFVSMNEATERPTIVEFLKDCQNPQTQTDQEVLEAKCLSKISELRQFIARNLITDKTKISEQEPTLLIHQLADGLRSVDLASKEDIELNIRLADNLIEKQPDLYVDYKAKMISLLVKELKYGEPVDLDTYESLYDELLSFDTGNPEEEGGFEVDEDLIHIPFVRQAALENFDELIVMADDYIAEYPDSYIGYYYLASGLWNAGDVDEAQQVLEEVKQQNLQSAALAGLFEQLQRTPSLQPEALFPLEFEFEDF